MSNYTEKPRILNTNDMFISWCKEKMRNKRHLRIRFQNTRAKYTVLVSKNGDELKWLIEHIDILEQKILALEIIEKSKVYFTKNIIKIYNMKTEINQCKERINHLNNVNLETEHLIMDDHKFKSIIYMFNKKVRDRMINNGEVVNMKQYLGYIHVQKVLRNHPAFKSKAATTVNWKESKLYKQELIDKGIQIRDKEHTDGKNWIVYYTDEWFLRIGWRKKQGACRVKNHTYYSFAPAKGPGGVRKQLSKANVDDPFLHKKYISRKIYYPSLPKEKIA